MRSASVIVESGIAFGVERLAGRLGAHPRSVAIHGSRRLARISRTQARGDSPEYDVAIEHGGDLVRVQVKSSSVRNGTGYFCQFRRNWLVEEPYSVDELDLFATYVIPVKTW